jgi:hypothetical protein
VEQQDLVEAVVVVALVVQLTTALAAAEPTY